MNDEDKRSIVDDIERMQDDGGGDEEGIALKQSDILINIAKRGALFHDYEGVGVC